ncbi:Tricarboxylate transport protein TctB [Sinorhizobium meliloti CCNWSX0020]|uniref:Tricarboxylate transport protein TctB n=1 Tax=Sinorhizobium meliloti CCNWSX0020 TaxID=1107881 RepID=H0FYE9_RHIML|nr:tripartite tricarboxylate transporter TctB family protein [Sinorhizobium meliloti]EHK78003.1 Tricarboxylate transport protein TctB [Sinorhizobium meliloti CCNWSX0020]RVE86953.1 tripartite tricarboxylate transporter TctB family protein [Sinorhizobium meliloti]RVG73104.1 tripartite tricarboxylate transporter TctB family protein [Sinorhizobium meliloti]RVH26579.1 tripartite tricarboxylate transporter TctB family protein [Sinorhizobium meliloti]RVH48485.1 tripartite tricarboxylate transporter T
MKSADADRASGYAFLAVALLFGIPAFGFGLGSFTRFGAGVFPLVISSILAIVGATLVLHSVMRSGEAANKILAFDFRAMTAVVGGMLFGAFCLRRFGLVVAVPGAVILASLASRELRPKGTLIAAAVLTLFAWLVFVVGLGIRLPLIVGLY